MKYKNIFLIGMTGAGKTFWGKKIAAALEKDFFDLDGEIESKEQKTILQIFLHHGEKYFRQKESDILRTFETKQNFVLATGGGTPCFFDNLSWLNKNGLTVWIHEPAFILAERLIHEKNHRPLIRDFDSDELLNFLQIKMEERNSCFSKAVVHIESPVHLIEDILKKINYV